MLIIIDDFKTYGRARSHPFKDAAEQTHLVGFLPARRDGRLAGTPTAHFGLQELEVNGDPRRHTVHDAANRSAVAFAERGQPKYVSKCIHDVGGEMEEGVGGMD
jgi:hypothetical protein